MLFLPLLVAAVLSCAPIIRAQTPTAYVGLGSESFGTVNLTTGTYSQAGNMGVLLSGLGVGPGGLLYGGVFLGNTLYQVNTTNGSLTVVGTSSLVYYDFGSTTTGVYALDQSLNLYSVNVSTGATTLIGSTGLSLPPNPWSGASTGADKLYLTMGTIGSPATLYSINTSTGAGTQIGNTGAPNLGAMVFENGTLYAGSGQNAPFNIYTMNPSTGQATLVTSTSSGSFWGLAPSGLTVNTLGTGSGTVSADESIDCIDTAGVQSGTCSASYNAGSMVNLTATPMSQSTFGGWGGACAGTGGCSVLVNSAQSVTASFVPQPTTVMVDFAPSSLTQTATFDCPPSPNPCTDPNAHSLTLTAGSVSTPFTMAVTATEVPVPQANGDCENSSASSSSVTNDFDCRFETFFNYGDDGSVGTIVPLCVPYANGNCVFYSVYYCVSQSGPCTRGQEPPTSDYQGPISWTITWNNETPPLPSTVATYQTANARLYDDPDYEVSSTAPYGTDCMSAMLINGSPTDPGIFCQFVYDITTFYNPTEPIIDSGIGGTTRQFNDVVVAYPPASTPTSSSIPQLSATSAPLNASVSYGGGIGFTIGLSNIGTGSASNVTLNDPLPGTGVNWTLVSPATGCSIMGMPPNQVLGCTFTSLGPGTGPSIGVTSSTANAGTYINAATVTFNNLQLLTIASLTVSQVGSTTTITSNTPNPSTTSLPVTIAFSVTGSGGSPTGSVTVNASTGESCSGMLSAGAGTCSITFTTMGTRTLTATYAGDGNFVGSTSGSASQTVNAAGSTLKFSSSSLNFGTIYSGTSALRALFVTNTGSSMVTFTKFSVASISGDDSAGFFGVELCPNTLNAGKSCTIIMSFTADVNATATHAANLVITDNASGSPQTVPLTAMVINPQVRLSMSSVNFGKQKARTTSGTRNVTLTNSGTTPLILSGLSISGNFALASGTTCTSSTTLAPGAPCVISVTFTPTSKGEKSGSVKISNNALNSSQYISLSGSGT
jgi:uncharacterized repeat protein (TIGR01451 family)